MTNDDHDKPNNHLPTETEARVQRHNRIGSRSELQKGISSTNMLFKVRPRSLVLILTSIALVSTGCGSGNYNGDRTKPTSPSTIVFCGRQPDPLSCPPRAG